MMDNAKVEQITKLYQERPEFLEFFKVLSTRERNRSLTMVDAFLKESETEEMGHEYARRRILTEFFRELQKVGLGTFKIGRRGKRSRFIWQTPILEVARVIGANESAHGDAKKKEKIDFPKDKSVTTEQQPEERSITHYYVLRESFTVELKLPADLTVIEADRLSAMIKTLPIQRYEEGEKL